VVGPGLPRASAPAVMAADLESAGFATTLSVALKGLRACAPDDHVPGLPRPNRYFLLPGP
jgi:hypothetical protein